MKKTIILVVTLLIGLNSFGQKKIDRFWHPLYQGKYTNNDFFNKAEFIFDAEIVSTENYTNEDTTKVYSSSVIKIHHIYKGEIDADTIEFVRNGGVFTEDNSSRIILYDNSHTQLYLKRRIILFAKKREGRTFNENCSIKLEPFDNSRRAALYYSECPSEHNFILFGLRDLYFKTFEDFHKYAIKQMENKESFHPKKKNRLEDDIKSKNRPIITSFYPTTLNAGVGDTLYILGRNFGSTEGQVWFKNADNGGDDFIEGSDGYITYWSDKLIKIIVPSYVKNNEDGNYYSAGTGLFKVIVDSVATTSKKKLTIGYSLTNVAASQLEDQRLYLVKRGNLNGIVFTLHENVKSNPKAVKCIEKALYEWSSYLCIELKLEKDSEGEYVTVSSNDIDGKNIIWESPDSSLMYSNFYTEECYGHRYKKGKGSIKYGKANWDYSTSGTVYSGTTSFYNAFLHELGHILGLGHVIDPNNLMYWAIDYTQAQNIIKLPQPKGTLDEAINRVMDDSKNINWDNCSNISTIEEIAPTVTHFELKNGKDTTYFRRVKLNNTCNIRPDKYIASERADFAGANWKKYEKNQNMRLSAGQAFKTVYYKVKNRIGESAVVSDQIYYIPYWKIPAEWTIETYRNGRFAEPNTSVNTISENDITVYPVPFSDYINIILPANQQDNYKLKVTDVNGRVILTTHITTKEKRINLSNLSKGIYFVTVIGNENIFYKKIVKQ